MTVPERLLLALESKAPWQMTLAEFGKAYKPIRCFQRYTSEQRADRAASFRLGPVQRDQVGEYCYVHPLLPDRAYPSPSRARRATHWYLIEQALRQGLPVPAPVLGDYPPLLWREFVQ
jgi:hypothetical protein